MAFRVAGLSVPGPSDVLGAAHAAAGWSAHAVDVAASLPERLGTVLDNVDQLVATITGVVQRTEELLDRASSLVDDAARATSATIEIVETYQPLADRAAPLAKRFVEELTEEEVQAAISLIDQLPTVTTAMERDVIPILATLDRVGPDVHELLDVLKEVRHAVTGIPGFRFFRKRGEEAEAEERDEVRDPGPGQP